MLGSSQAGRYRYNRMGSGPTRMVSTGAPANSVCHVRTSRRVWWDRTIQIRPRAEAGSAAILFSAVPSAFAISTGWRAVITTIHGNLGYATTWPSGAMAPTGKLGVAG